MGRVGGITCPYIISRSASLRTIGLVMFSVSIATSIFVKCLPETSGKEMGNFDVDREERRQRQPSVQMTRSRNSSSRHGPDVPASLSDDDILNQNECGIFSGDLRDEVIERSVEIT